MLRTTTRVVKSEGVASALTRASERIEEGSRRILRRLLAPVAPAARIEILNYAPASMSPRTGGVAIQLAARLAEEKRQRNVALYANRRLRLLTPFEHERPVSTLDEAIVLSGAQALHIEGTNRLDLRATLELIDRGFPVVVSNHDFSLFCSHAPLIETATRRFCAFSRDAGRCQRCRPRDDQQERRILGRRLLESAAGLTFCSQFLLDTHRELFDLPLRDAVIVEPSSSARAVPGGGAEIAFAGSVAHHKGAHFLPEIADALAPRGRSLHVFGGLGELDLFAPLRRRKNVVIHGYYRAGSLPALLARHHIGLVLIPSIFPETYSIVLSEAWLAGASVGAFDFAAPADRIRKTGFGALAPLDSGAAGLIELIEHWTPAPVSVEVPSAADGAAAMIRAYRSFGLPAT